SFDAYVVPGLYFLRLVGTVSNQAFFGAAFLTAQVPAYNARQIVLDPNTAQNDTDPLRTVDNNFGDWGTEFYEVKAPGGVQSALAVGIDSPAPPSKIPYGLVEAAVFKKIAGGYQNVGSAEIDFGASGGTIINTNSMPVPGDDYFICISRDRQPQDVLV